jgi:DNA primase
MQTRTPTRLTNLDGLKQEIADSIDIVDVARQLCDVDPVKSGGQWKACCPLHGEDTPSFYLNPSKGQGGMFHCFGCKEGGDAISLVQKVLHLGFTDALVTLAGAADVDVEAYRRPATEAEQREDGFRGWAENALSERAVKHDVGGRVKDPEVLAAYEIGSWGADQQLPDDPPDYFKDKLYLFDGVIFPYRTPGGRLVGWKARQPDKKMFGMSGDFPLLAPAVYGFNVARDHLVGGALTLVEGEYDVLALAEHGIRDVAGLGGGRLSDEQLRLLKDHKVKRITFWADGDEAGRAAAEKLAKAYWEDNEIELRIALCPAGADPEDVVRAMGEVAARQQIAAARGALEWLLWEEWQREPRATLTAKLDFVRWIQAEYGPRLTGVAETLVLKEAARWLQVPEADVLDFARAEKSALQAVDSERVLLGRCVRDTNYFLTLRKRLVAADFYVLKHQRVWAILVGMLEEGLDFDLVIAKKHAEASGVEPDYLDLLASTNDLNIGWHEDRVIDLAVRRGAQQDADHFREVIADVSVPANQLIGGLTHAVTSKALGRGSGAFVGIAEQVDEAMDKLQERMKNPNEVYGISMGSQFPTLTRNLQGWQKRRLVLVAATSGGGKSTLTLEYVTAMSVGLSVPCDFVSLEMDSDEILFKQCSHLTGIDSLKISGGSLTPDEARRVEKAMMRLRNSPLRIYCPDGITPNEFVLYARESVMERRTEVFVLDYAQMVGPDADTVRLSRYEQLGRFAYSAKQKVCRGLDTTVICCAQLKRDAAGKEEPTPEDMGDSYELVRAADVILLLNQLEDGNELWIGKNRQGPGQVCIPLHYDKPSQTLRESNGSKTPDYAVL